MKAKSTNPSQQFQKFHRDSVCLFFGLPFFRWDVRDAIAEGKASAAGARAQILTTQTLLAERYRRAAERCYVAMTDDQRDALGV